MGTAVKYISPEIHFQLKEELYLKVRNFEKRIFTDDQVRKLPILENHHPLADEWKYRTKSLTRMTRFIHRISPESVLDIGCGNGWLIGQLSTILGSTKYTGIDVNKVELEQANRLFGNKLNQFLYLDPVEDLPPDSEHFDLIILNASVQYFQNLSSIISRCQSWLKEGGHIIINDSPFYENAEAAKAASDRSRKYYRSTGFEKMADFYFHHSFEELIDLGFKKYSSGVSFTSYAFPLFIYQKP